MRRDGGHVDDGVCDRLKDSSHLPPRIRLITYCLGLPACVCVRACTSCGRRHASCQLHIMRHVRLSVGAASLSGHALPDTNDVSSSSFFYRTTHCMCATMQARPDGHWRMSPTHAPLLRLVAEICGGVVNRSHPGGAYI